MKKIMITLCLVCVAHLSYSQNDTLTQQTAIRNNISKYIGKPFSVLYNDLTLKPKSIFGHIATKYVAIEPSHDFYYAEPDSDSDIYIFIEWQAPPLKTLTQKYQNYMERAFNAQEYLTYKDLIIKKLELYPKP